MNTIKVRCTDRMVFRVRPDTYEALSCECYDPYCYIDPEPGVTYIEYSDWCELRRKQRDKECTK